MTPPAYCITCDQTPERGVAAARHFRERGLGVTFFRGVHGPTWGLRTAKEAHPGYAMGPGHVGLCLSHWALWQHLWLACVPEALVLEDDAVLVPDFVALLARAVASLPAGWELVYAGSVGTEGKAREEIRPGVVRVEMPFGTHCYLVRRKALPVLIETNQEARHHLDIQLAQNSLPRLEWYVLWPPLAGQRSYSGEWPTCAGVPAGAAP